MKTGHIFLAVATVFLLFTACKNNENSETENQETEIKNAVPDMHNAKNSLDWPGNYFGVLPCASCPGINTHILLNQDGTYEKIIEYLESDDTPETSKGQIIWNEDGNIITIEENTYLVSEGMLYALDANNKVIEGELAEKYILKKTELQPALDINDGYTLEQYTGSDKKEYDIIFNTNNKIPTALIKTDGLEKELKQTEAWAKGAEYSDGGIELRVNGDNATLIINNKKIELKKK